MQCSQCSASIYVSCVLITQTSNSLQVTHIPQFRGHPAAQLCRVHLCPPLVASIFVAFLKPPFPPPLPPPRPPNTCIKPGTCTPPVTPYSAVARGPQPGLQWDFSGGFCGSFSVQQGALSQGAWISQDKVSLKKVQRATSLQYS